MCSAGPVASLTPEPTRMPRTTADDDRAHVGRADMGRADMGRADDDRVHAGGSPARRRFPDAALLGILIGSVVTAGMLAIGLLYTGAAAATLVDDAGALVRWGLPVVNVVYNISVSITIGSLMLAAVVVPRTDGSRARGRAASTPADPERLNPAWRRLLGLASGASVVWTLAAIGMLLLGYIDTVGSQSLQSGNFSAQLGVYITHVAAGTYWLVAVVVAAMVSTAVFGVRSYGGVALLGVVALFGLLPQALTGHAADASNHDLAVSSIGLHIAGVSVWLGGLIALTMLATILGRNVGEIVERYSSIAIFAYCLVALSGISTSYVQVGSWAGMVSRYGALIIIKSIAMILLGFIGWWHREFIIARLKKDPDAAAPSILSGSRKAGAAPGRQTTGGRTASARAMFWRFVGGELVLLGLASGAAVALSRSPKPAGQAAPNTPSAAEQLTGYGLPPAMSPAQWLADWRLDLWWAVAALTALVLYWRGVYAIRSRGGVWSVRRGVLWTVGLAVLVYATSGPPEVYGTVMFSAHTVQHFTVMLVAAALLALGSPVTLLMSARPARTDGSRGGREWVLIVTRSRVARLLANPIAAAVLLTGSIAAFYFTPLIDLTIAGPIRHDLMIAYFLVVGYLFAQSVLGIDFGRLDPARAGNVSRPGLRLAAAAGFAVAMVALGIYLMQSNLLLDADWFGNTGRPWGPDAITDQQRGGLLVVIFGVAPVLGLIAHVVASGRIPRALSGR